MASLTKCKTCKKEVSLTAKLCPHCGQKDPGTNNLHAAIIGIVLVGLIWFGVKSCSGKTEPENKQVAVEQSSNSETAAPQENKTLDINNTLNITVSQFKNAYNKNMKKLGVTDKSLLIRKLPKDTSMIDGVSVYDIVISNFAHIVIRANKASNKIIDLDIQYILSNSDKEKRTDEFAAMAGFVTVVLDSTSSEVNTEEARNTVMNLLKSLSEQNKSPAVYVSGLKLQLIMNYSSTKDDSQLLAFSISR